MANSYHRLYVHFVWAPRHRDALITPELKRPLEDYLSGILKNLKGETEEIYACPDHLHLLARLRTTHAVSKVANQLKSNSSKWVRDTYDEGFAWQDGGGYFSVGWREVEAVGAYIRDQAAHHGLDRAHEAVESMPEEFRRLLDEHGLLDERERAYWLQAPL